MYGYHPVPMIISNYSQQKFLARFSHPVVISVIIQYFCCEHVLPCRALLYISHGVGEYMGRYEKLGQFLSEHDIFVFGHDHGEWIWNLKDQNDCLKFKLKQKK